MTPEDETSFKTRVAYERRCKICAQLLAQYPDRAPVILERIRSGSSLTSKGIRPLLPSLSKFLVPFTHTVGQFLAHVRREIGILREETALYLFVGRENVLPPVGQTFDALYNRFKDDDGFLYITCAGEQTFGFSDTEFRSPPARCVC